MSHDEIKSMELLDGGGDEDQFGRRNTFKVSFS